jgi:hypothetical protein
LAIQAKRTSKYAKLFQKKTKESQDGKFASVSPLRQIVAQKNFG